jgi:hypothetical protein
MTYMHDKIQTKIVEVRLMIRSHLGDQDNNIKRDLRDTDCKYVSMTDLDQFRDQGWAFVMVMSASRRAKLVVQR